MREIGNNLCTLVSIFVSVFNGTKIKKELAHSTTILIMGGCVGMVGLCVIFALIFQLYNWRKLLNPVQSTNKNKKSDGFEYEIMN